MEFAMYATYVWPILYEKVRCNHFYITFYLSCIYRWSNKTNMSAKSCQAYSLLKLTQLIWKVLVLPVRFNQNWFQAKHFFAISCFPLICLSDSSGGIRSNNTFTYTISTFAFLFYRRELIPNVIDIDFLRSFRFFNCDVFKRTLTV